ncbi:uncharacterized protein [Temnothorax longispinosus]|uniref:uncharacterized protein isoform X1 n=2 Tax=Temnothorax longispinosus TaxID=300112 RepID=UPI003A9929E6
MQFNIDMIMLSVYSQLVLKRSCILLLQTMDHERYMVCEFPNEEDSISIGYLEWLEDKFKITELDDIIERGTIVKVRWPKNCDVGPPTATMKKKLANCQWEKVVTKLRAYGGWIKMREIRDNLEKYGVTELDKHDRKQFTKRQTTESDSDESEVKGTKKSALTKSKQKKCTLNEKKGKELLKQYKHNKQKYSSQSKSVDDECDTDNEKSPVQLKSQLTIIELNEENKKLQRDNKRLRTLRSVNEDLPKIEKMVKDLTVNLQSASKKIESLNDQIDKLEEKIQAINNCIIEREQGYTPPAMTLDSDPFCISKLNLPNNKLESSATDASPASIMQNKELDLPSDKLKSSQRSVTEFCEPASHESTPLTFGHNLVPQNSNPESLLEDFPDTPDVAIKVVNTRELEHVHESNHAADTAKSSNDHQSIAIHKPKEQTVDLGGPEPCIVNAIRLSLCNHTSVSKLICEMMSLLFSKEELATSSLTGTVANFHCEKGIAAKKKLDTVKIEAMKAYVKKKFPAEKDFDKMFRKAVQQKCNNAVPRNRGLNNKGETN